jgi:HSP20 family protein
MNQSGPFWDFVASLEDGEHPFFASPTGGDAPSAGPWGPHSGPWGRRAWHHHHHGSMPHRGPPEDGTNPPPENNDSPATAKEDDVEMETKEVPDPPEDTPREPGEGCQRRRCGGPGGRRGGGRHGMHGFHGRHGGPRGGPWAGGFGGPGFRMLSGLFQPQEASNENNDWSPEVDVFDTQSAYVVHASLPGAAKEDVGVTWDPERSELAIAGVVHRPGDEEFLKTLALDERKVGAFERKVRLGTRANPAQVDVDGIVAKFENGILIIEVPKMMGEFVEIKKVDIE